MGAEEKEEKAPELENEVEEETIVEAEEPVEALTPQLAELKQEVADLEAQLSEKTDKAVEYLDGWQRAQAAFSNYRKRVDADRENWEANAKALIITRLLPLMDDFERAFAAIPENVQDASWLNGISLIQRKLMQVFEAERVKPIELDPGDEFDPLFHQAVMYQESEDFGEGQVIAETQRGYMFKERVIRPSMVIVAKATTTPAVVITSEAEGEDIEAVEQETVASADPSSATQADESDDTQA